MVASYIVDTFITNLPNLPSCMFKHHFIAESLNSLVKDTVDKYLFRSIIFNVISVTSMNKITTPVQPGANTE